MFEDKTLVCRDCGKEFVFSASEQQFFADKGFQNDPTRCHECRAARRNRENPGRAERQYFEVICDGCGCTTQVPFQPKGDRPVYKLVGPVLVKQDLEEAKDTITKRLQYIQKQMAERDEQIQALVVKGAAHQKIVCFICFCCCC